MQANGAPAAVVGVELGLVVGDDTIANHKVALLPPVKVVRPFVQVSFLAGRFDVERFFSALHMVVFITAKRELAIEG